jgi:hypothetical protein
VQTRGDAPAGEMALDLEMPAALDAVPSAGR